MSKVYILGAGASKFADFPLGRGLGIFLKREGEVRHNDIQTKKDVASFFRIADIVCNELGWSKDDIQDFEWLFTEIDLALQKEETLKRFGSNADSVLEAQRACKRLISLAFKARSSQLFLPIFKDQTSKNGCADENFVELKNKWAKRINHGDTIITFNWDCLQEMILWKERKWNYRDGYGFEIESENGNPSQVLILKLHGSCNWAVGSLGDPNINVDYLSDMFPGTYNHYSSSEPYGTLDHQPISSDFGEMLVNPSYLKNPFNIPALVLVWEQAYQRIAKAEEIVVIGYSLPDADLAAITMLSLALRKSPLSNFKFVGNSAFGRWVEFGSKLEKEVEQAADSFEKYLNS